MAPRSQVAVRPKLVEAFQTAITSKSGASFPSLTRLQKYQIEFDPAYDKRNGDQFVTFKVFRDGIEEHPARVTDRGFEYTVLDRNVLTDETWATPTCRAHACMN